MVLAGRIDDIMVTLVQYLYRKGFNVYLMSDDQDRLNELQGYYKNDLANGQFKSFHLASSERVTFDAIQNELKSIEITMCILKFTSINKEKVVDNFLPTLKHNDTVKNLKSNLLFNVKLSKMVLDQFETRNQGTLIIFTSLSSILPCPLMSVDAASSQFTDYLARCLVSENNHDKINIKYVKHVELSEISPSLKWLEPGRTEYVKKMFNELGYKPCTTGYWLFDIIWFISWQLRNWNKILLIELNTKIAYRILSKFN